MGGLETVAMNIVRYANRDKFEFDFLVYGNYIGAYEKEARALGCNIIHIIKPKGYLAFYKKLKSVIEENGPYGIVHSHTYFNSGIVMLAAYRCHVPFRLAHTHSIKRNGDDRITKKYSITLCVRL